MKSTHNGTGQRYIKIFLKGQKSMIYPMPLSLNCCELQPKLKLKGKKCTLLAKGNTAMLHGGCVI